MTIAAYHRLLLDTRSIMHYASITYIIYYLIVGSDSLSAASSDATNYSL